MRKLSQTSINVLRRNWKTGRINRFDIFLQEKQQLRSFEIISRDPIDGYYRINRDKYSNLVKGKEIKQLKLIAEAIT